MTPLKERYAPRNPPRSHQKRQLLLSVSIPIYLSLPPLTDHSGGGATKSLSPYSASASRQAVFVFPRNAVSNAVLKAASTYLSPPTDYSGGKGAYLFTASTSPPTDHSGDDGVSSSELDHTPIYCAFATTHRHT